MLESWNWPKDTTPLSIWLLHKMIIKILNGHKIVCVLEITWLLFFSLDRPVTKNQILNIKCQLTFFDIVTIRKEKGQSGLIPFKIVTIAKKHWLTFGVSYLVFSHPLMEWKEHLCDVCLNSIVVNKCYVYSFSGIMDIFYLWRLRVCDDEFWHSAL